MYLITSGKVFKGYFLINLEKKIRHLILQEVDLRINAFKSIRFTSKVIDLHSVQNSNS